MSQDVCRHCGNPTPARLVSIGRKLAATLDRLPQDGSGMTALDLRALLLADGDVASKESLFSRLYKLERKGLVRRVRPPDQMRSPTGNQVHWLWKRVA